MYSLFTYGTLQLESVQLEVFGRALDGQPDTLIGYRMEGIVICDAAVVATLGIAQYPVIVYTGDCEDVVDGVVFLVTERELFQADVYEGADYKRVSVTAASGKSVFVYVKAGDI